MRTLWSQYFGFREDPFGSTPDPHCLFESDTHREALASLKYGTASNRGFTALIAPPGMGKTALLFRLLDDIRARSSNVFLFDLEPQCQPIELLAYILRDIGVTPAQTSAEMHEQLKEILVAVARARRQFVLVIDEAQNLSESVLETVRLLNNFETTQSKLIQVVLSGQPQLADKLMSPSLVQLRQRISTFCRIEPLSSQETFAYINYRLKYAEYKGPPLFSADAMSLIAANSQGVPRIINTLCFNSLSLCFAVKRRTVDRRIAAETIGDRRLTPLSIGASTVPVGAFAKPDKGIHRRPVSRVKRRWAPVLVTVLVLCILGSIGSHRIEKTTINPVQNPSRFEVTVEANQTVAMIAKQYLGGFNQESLQMIKSLNPGLSNPNHIQPGQKIWLPGPQLRSATTNAASSDPMRNLK
jgi:general secretion pathway protein A